MKENKNKETSITLLSNGSFNLYKDNSLTSFTNKLHNPINLDSSLYHYVALQEIGISLNAENIPVPTSKPAIFYIEWDLNIYMGYKTNVVFNDEQILSLGSIEAVTQGFVSAFNDVKEKLFINYPNNLGVYSIKQFIEKKNYTPLLIEKELKSFENIFSNDKLKLSFDFISDYTTKFYFDHHYQYKDFEPSFFKHFIIKCSENKYTPEPSLYSDYDNQTFVGLLLHENLAKALKFQTYFRRTDYTSPRLYSDLNDNNLINFEIPEQIEIDKEIYYLYFIKINDEIRGGIFFENSIPLEDNNIINVESNIINPYVSNEKFCTTIATFNNLSNGEKFHYYYPNNLIYYRIKLDQIQDISIFISDKDNKQIQLFKDTPTILKLVIRSQTEMNFTSNLRVSNKAPSTSYFYNTNSLFRVNLPSNEIFQSETSEIAISSVTYPNRFKLLPSYLKADVIKSLYMYSKNQFSRNAMELGALVKDVNSVISNDPNILVNN